MASSSTPLEPTALEHFKVFLQTTEGKDRVDLHGLFTQFVDLNATVALNIQSFQPVLDFITTYIDTYAVPIRGQDELWVPCDLLCYIHQGDRLFVQRLQRFCAVAREAGQYIETLHVK